MNMNVVAWLATGIAAGWIAHRLFSDHPTEGRIGHIVLGIVGAFLGVQLLGPAVETGGADRNAFSVSLLLYSAVGSGVLLFVGNAVRERFFP